MSPGPGNSRQWSQWPEQDGAQTQSFLATHCPPPSSCAMSSLLLLPYRASEAAEAYEAGTDLCPSLWRQKIPHPVPANNSMLAQLMHKATALNSLTKAFICVWCAFIYIWLPFSSCSSPSFSPHAKTLFFTLPPFPGPTQPQKILQWLGGLSFSLSNLAPLQEITE